MCEIIILDGRVIETVGSAKSALPGGLVFDPEVADRKTAPQADECLCWLDMEATAALNGYVANNQHGGDPFEWIFTTRHTSDCAMHNKPAMPNGPCDCREGKL